MDRDREDRTVLDPYRRTPPLSLEGSREVLHEMARPPADTPERRALFARVRRREEVRERWPQIARGLHHPGEPIILDEQGSREVIDEIVNGSPLTPERRATFERMRLMADVHRRNAELDASTPPPDHERFVESRALGLQLIRRRIDMRKRPAEELRPAEIEQGRHYPGEPVVLSEEGSREVLDEIKNGSPATPGRRAMFELVRQMEGMRKRGPGSSQHVERKR